MADRNALGIVSASEAAFASLQHQLDTLPVPVAPPRYPASGASVGISLLDAALNQNHLVRRTENLVVFDRNCLRRRISVHVSLDRLTPAQRAAGMRYGHREERAGQIGIPVALPHKPSPNGSRSDDVSGKARLLWVPVTRVPREVSTPVTVYDDEGRELARATQPELLPVINAAMYSLLRMVLRAEPEAQKAGSALHGFLDETNRARWLLERAVASMIHGCPQEDHATPEQPRRHPGDDPEELDARRTAREISERFIQERTALLELLYLASNEHIIVAGLLPTKEEHHLTFEAPALPAVRSREACRPSWSLARSLLPFGRRFTFRYDTHLSPGLDSFHASVEVGPGVRVREALLVTDCDDPRCQDLAGRLEQFADLPAGIRNTRHCRDEIDQVVAELGELAARRIDESLVYRARWEERRRRLGVRQPTWPVPRPELQAVHQQLQAARTGVQHPTGGATAPAVAARMVQDLELGYDLTVGDSGGSDVVHMNRRQDLLVGRQTWMRSSAASVHVTLTDDPPPAVRSVLPPGGTLAGRLRTLDRLAAFLAIALTCGLAVVAATDLASALGTRTTLLVAPTGLLLLFVVTAIDRACGRFNAGRPSLNALDVPQWLRARRTSSPPKYDAVFTSRGTEPSHGRRVRRPARAHESSGEVPRG
jgi:hypothetical protein